MWKSVGLLERLRRKKEERTRPHVTAIIAAAGSGTRMGDTYGCGKQLISLRGEPGIAHTLRAFQRAETIEEIVVVAREEEIVVIADIVKGIEADKVTEIVVGGDSRQESVAKGLARVSPKSRFIAIHDGARPLVRPELIDRTACAALEFGAAAVGVPVKERLKHVSEKGFISGTVHRETLVQIQTPQIFEVRDYAAGIALARTEGAVYTDDCQLYERLGKPIKLVEGDYENIKITTCGDMDIAEAVLERRVEELLR